MKKLIIFASLLFLVADKAFSESIVSSEMLTEVQAKKPTASRSAPRGTYYCSKTREYYIFNSNGTGKFVTGVVSSSFRWKVKGSFVVVSYSGSGGKTELQFNRSSNYLIESSSILGTLIYEKSYER